MKAIKINKRKIGPGRPVYIVAEMSANHNSSIKTAQEIVKAAKEAGADAVKIQTYTPDTITMNCDNEYFILRGTAYDGRTLYDLFSETYTPWEWQPELKKLADSLGIDLFSTPFDNSAVNFLEKMKIPAYKVASSEIVDIPLLQKVASTGKPMIISTGMASLGEIEIALDAVRKAGAKQILLMKCTASYPALPEEMNILTMANMAQTFSLPVGLSDHSLGVEIPIAAVSLGACMIEKHFTISRADGGPDSSFSMEFDEFKAMVKAIRNVEKALGTVKYGPVDREKASKRYRRSLFVTKNIKIGEKLNEQNIRSIRPGNGLPPVYIARVLGRKVVSDLKTGTPLAWEHIDWSE